MKIRFNLFPEGRQCALTFSYDDGRIQDRPLTALLDKYGLHGTFHLCSGLLNQPGHITSREVSSLYRNHEVACHSCSHPFLNQMPPQMLLNELGEDKAALEDLTGYPVRGLSWPFGAVEERSVQAAKLCGLEYSRCTRSSGSLNLPEDWLRLAPTAHHMEPLLPILDKLLDSHRGDMRLCYIWGHSFELDHNDGWTHLEEFCCAASNRCDIWYATNIQIKEYLDALSRLVFNAKLTMAYNPSALPLWFSADNVPVCIQPGQIWREDNETSERRNER